MKTAITLAILTLGAMQANAWADPTAGALSGVPLSVAKRLSPATPNPIGASQVGLSGAPLAVAKQPTAAPTPGTGAVEVAKSGVPMNIAKLSNPPQNGARSAAMHPMGMHASGMATGAGAAAESGITRAQVTAELDVARQRGETVANAESGLKFYEVYPALYPHPAAVTTLTREQVTAELAAARQRGDTLAQNTLKPRDIYPALYPQQAPTAGLTRAEVKAELAEAARTGNYFEGGEVTALCVEAHPNMHAPV